MPLRVLLLIPDQLDQPTAPSPVKATTTTAASLITEGFNTITNQVNGSRTSRSVPNSRPQSTVFWKFGRPQSQAQRPSDIQSTSTHVKSTNRASTGSRRIRVGSRRSSAFTHPPSFASSGTDSGTPPVSPPPPLPPLPVVHPKDERGRPMLTLNTNLPKIGNMVTYYVDGEEGSGISSRRGSSSTVTQKSKAGSRPSSSHSTIDPPPAPTTLIPPFRIEMEGYEYVNDETDFTEGKRVEFGWWKRDEEQLTLIFSRRESLPSAPRGKYIILRSLSLPNADSSTGENTSIIPTVLMTELTSLSYTSPVACLQLGIDRKKLITPIPTSVSSLQSPIIHPPPVNTYQFPLPPLSSEQRNALHSAGLLVYAVPRGYEGPIPPVVATMEEVEATRPPWAGEGEMLGPGIALDVTPATPMGPAGVLSPTWTEVGGKLAVTFGPKRPQPTISTKSLPTSPATSLKSSPSTSEPDSVQEGFTTWMLRAQKAKDAYYYRWMEPGPVQKSSESTSSQPSPIEASPSSVTGITASLGSFFSRPTASSPEPSKDPKSEVLFDSTTKSKSENVPSPNLADQKSLPSVPSPPVQQPQTQGSAWISWAASRLGRSS